MKNTEQPKNTEKPIEIKKDYILIKSWIARRITKEQANDKKYSDDYFVISATSDLVIIDFDKRSIRPYAMELLNSMNELSFTKLIKYCLRSVWVVLLIILIVFIRGNWKAWIIEEVKNQNTTLKTQIEKICENSWSTTTTSIRHTNIRTNAQQ